MASAPVRQSLSTLICFVRELVGEGDTDTSDLTDNAIQSALDETREMVRYERLYPVLSILPATVTAGGERIGGLVEYKDFTADPYLDDDLQVLSGNYFAFVRADFSEFDPMQGRFSLTLTQPTAIYIVGDRYDPFAAAADLLTSMAARQKGAVDFSEVGLSIKSSQTAPQMLALAAEYRRKARIRSFEFGRSDIR